MNDQVRTDASKAVKESTALPDQMTRNEAFKKARELNESGKVHAQVVGDRLEVNEVLRD